VGGPVRGREAQGQVSLRSLGGAAAAARARNFLKSSVAARLFSRTADLAATVRSAARETQAEARLRAQGHVRRGSDADLAPREPGGARSSPAAGSSPSSRTRCRCTGAVRPRTESTRSAAAGGTGRRPSARGETPRAPHTSGDRGAPPTSAGSRSHPWRRDDRPPRSPSQPGAPWQAGG
jgi:hypothetical protein